MNEIGQSAERRVADALFAAGWFLQRRSARHKRDIAAISQRGIELIEVKNEDSYANRSRNICIELQQGQPRRPSGILTSESTVTVHTFGEDCLVYRTQPMRLYIWEMPGPRYMDFGDNNNCGLILPRQDLVVQSWAEWLPLARIAFSKVFDA
jgi:hypothetical protein